MSPQMVFINCEPQVNHRSNSQTFFQAINVAGENPSAVLLNLKCEFCENGSLQDIHYLRT